MANAALEHDAMALMRQTELDFGLTIDAGPAFYGRRQGADAAVCWTKVHYRTQNIYSQIWLFHEATEQPEISGWPASGFHTTSDGTRIAQTTREAGSAQCHRARAMRSFRNRDITWDGLQSITDTLAANLRNPDTARGVGGARLILKRPSAFFI